MQQEGVSMAKRRISGLLLVIILGGLILSLSCNFPFSSLGDKKLSQEQALQLVLDEVVQPDLLGEDPLVVFAWPEPLVPGDTLHPYAVYGEDPAANLIEVEEESWFFWIEDEPFARFTHPNRYALVEIRSGELSVSNADWWPVLNGQSLWTDDRVYKNEANWVFANISLKKNTGNSREYNSSMLASMPPLQKLGTAASEGGNRLALVINTVSNGEFGEADAAADVKNMLRFLDENNFESTYLGPANDTNPRRSGEPFDSNSLDPWRVWLQTGAEEMNPRDTLVVYISGHGLENHVVGSGGVIGSEDLGSDLSGFKPCVDIIVIIDSNKSGSFIDELEDVADLNMTATDATRPSYSDIEFAEFLWESPVAVLWFCDPNPLDEGSEYTSSLIAGWEEIKADPAKMEMINQRVQDEDITFMGALLTGSWNEGIKFDPSAQRGESIPQVSYGSEEARACSSTSATATDPASGDSAQACAVFEEIVILNTIMRHMRNCKPTLNFYYKLDVPVPGLASASPIAWDYWVLANGNEGDCFLEEGFDDRLYCRVDIYPEEANHLGHFKLYANPCQEPVSILDLTIPRLEGCEEPATESEEPLIETEEPIQD
jgi:hypothetical protein